jgi:hypothetical protein
MNFSVCRPLAYCIVILGTIIPGANASKTNRSFDRPTIALISHGRVVVTTPGVAMTSPATLAQKWQWQSLSDEPATISPNGRYRFDAHQTGVYDARSGLVVLSPSRIKSSVSDSHIFHPDHFSGWLPDSAHFSLTNYDANSSAEYAIRSILSVQPTKAIAFNGWMSDDGRVAIVPNTEGSINDCLPYSASLDQPGSHVTETKLTFYTAVLPSNVEAYRFTNARRKKLMLTGHPLRLNVGRTQVEFSPDDRWAICDRSILVDLKTGVARKLPGKSAHFLRHTGDDQNLRLGEFARLSAGFLTSVAPREQLSVVRKRLSPSTILGKPHWVQSLGAWGNYISFQGPLNGCLVFLDPTKPMHGRMLSSENDALNYIELYLPPNSMNTVSYAKHVTKLLSRFLGPVEHTEMHAEGRDYTASWILRDKRQIVYDTSWQRLRLTFPYSIGGEPDDQQ